MTYSVFADAMWRKIQRNKEERQIDPALVWTEIKSYIKGSSEALNAD